MVILMGPLSILTHCPWFEPWTLPLPLPLQVVSQVRALVLASGTLAPVSGLVAQLFSGVPAQRLRHYACGHVVGQAQLLAMVVGRGPSGLPLELRHSARSTAQVMDEVRKGADLQRHTLVVQRMTCCGCVW